MTPYPKLKHDRGCIALLNLTRLLKLQDIQSGIVAGHDNNRYGAKWFVHHRREGRGENGRPTYKSPEWNVEL